MLGKLNQWFAVDELHCQEKLTSLRHAAVNQFGDVWVIERGEDLPFASKVLFEFPIGQTLANYLQGDVLLKLAVSTFSQEYRAHTAAPNLLQNSVSTKAFALILVAVCLQLRRQVDGMLLKQVLWFFVSREKRFDFCA